MHFQQKIYNTEQKERQKKPQKKPTRSSISQYSIIDRRIAFLCADLCSRVSSKSRCSHGVNSELLGILILLSGNRCLTCVKAQTLLLVRRGFAFAGGKSQVFAGGGDGRGVLGGHLGLLGGWLLRAPGHADTLPNARDAVFDGACGAA